MLIVCPNCATSYTIDAASLGPAGRTVRCARCQSTWFAGGEGMAPEVAAAAVEADTSAADRVEATQASPEPMPPLPDHKPTAIETEEPPAMAGSPPLVPPMEPAPTPETVATDSEGEDVESFAVRRQRLRARRQKALRSSRWTAILLVLLGFNVALIGARKDLVRHLPQTAPFFAAIGLPVNLRQIQFEHVKISKETAKGAVILVVQGTLASTAGVPVKVPRLRFAVRNADGQELYSWTELPSRSVLAPGERLEFRTQLAAPPKGTHDVLVRFFTAADATAEAK